MYAPAEKALLLKNLTRIDSNISDCITTFPFVGHYKRDEKSKAWEKTGIEGPLYIAKTLDDQYILVISNQSNAIDFHRALLPTAQYTTQENYIFWKTSEATWGIWFHDDVKRKECWHCIATLLIPRGMKFNAQETSLSPVKKEAAPAAAPAAAAAAAPVSATGADILQLLKKNKNDEPAAAPAPVVAAQAPAVAAPAPVPAVSTSTVAAAVLGTPSNALGMPTDRPLTMTERVARELLGMVEFQQLVDRAVGVVLSKSMQ